MREKHRRSHSQGTSGENPRQNHGQRVSGEKKNEVKQHGYEDSEKYIEATMRSQSSAQSSRRGETMKRTEKSTANSRQEKSIATAGKRRAEPTAGKRRAVPTAGKRRARPTAGKRRARPTAGRRAETFLQIQLRPVQHPQELNPWRSRREEPLHSSTVEKSESQTQVQDQRCQSGPSARYSVIPSEGRFSNKYGADQRRLQISDPHFDKFTTPATFACWKIRFKTEVCTCSQFPTEAMQWIKEVEFVDSVDDLKPSSSKRGIRMPDSEALDAKIASALNEIIHNSHFKRRVSLEEQKSPKRGPFPSRKTDRLPDLRVFPGHWSQ